MAKLSPYKPQFFEESADGSGAAFLVGGKLYSYLAGTTTPTPTYTDESGTAPNTNPVVLDARGEANVWIDETIAYKFVLTDSDDVQIWSLDNVRVGEDLAIPGGADLIGFLQAGAGAVPRTVQSKLRETVSVTDFGATGDGATDDTSALQAAINAASGRQLVIPAGTYIVTSLNGGSNIEVVGDWSGLSILKRKSSTLGNDAILTFNGASGFKVSGITFDGDKANQSNAAHGLLVYNCSDYEVSDCRSVNNKSVSSGYGSGIVIASDGNYAAGTTSRVLRNKCNSNDGAGILVSVAHGLDIVGNECRLNAQGGIDIQAFAYPPVVDANGDILVDGNQCLNNTGAGITVSGGWIGGTQSKPIFGVTSPVCERIRVVNNRCDGNTLYGIAYQGADGVVADNTLRGNGTGLVGGGMLFNAWNSTSADNVFYDNSYYGIDAGGSANCLIKGNKFRLTGFTSGAGCNCLNIGGSVDVTVENNSFEDNGSVGNGVMITVLLNEGDGATPFDQVANGAYVENNKFSLKSGQLAVWVQGGIANVKVAGNRCRGGTVGDQYHLEFGSNCRVHDNNNAIPSIASAATLIIPDEASGPIYVTGTTGITGIQTYSSNGFAGKVSTIIPSSPGSGYTSAPTVTLTGGGGVGATATAQISNSGKLAAFTITNPGSGYTSAPTVNVSGGGGVGGGGTAIVGCNNFEGREISLMFQNGLTVTDGGNLALAGNYTSAANGGVLKLRGAYGGWYEASRSTV